MRKNFNKQLGDRIRSFRIKCGMTQQYAGQIVGYSDSQISNLEMGKSSITAEQVLLFSGAFNIPVSDFYNGIYDTAEYEQERHPYIRKLFQLNEDYHALVCEMIDRLLVIQQSDN